MATVVHKAHSKSICLGFISLRKYVGSREELLRGGALRGVACVGNMLSSHKRLRCIPPLGSKRCFTAAHNSGASRDAAAQSCRLITAESQERRTP